MNSHMQTHHLINKHNIVNNKHSRYIDEQIKSEALFVFQKLVSK